MEYEHFEKYDMLSAFIESGRDEENALILYYERFPERRQPFRDIFKRLEHNLKTYGQFRRPRSKKYVKENLETREAVVLGYVEARTQSKPGEVEQAVKDAIDIGYRHIDCAYVYDNEKEVGAGLAAKFADGTIKREDIWITSKLWNSYHRPDLVEKNLKITLNDLGLSYLDLYLIHWPTGYKEELDNFPKDAAGNIIFSDVDYLDTWKAMEGIAKKGLAKSIGLSNFNKAQITRILENSTIKPAVLQIECHPYLNQTKLIEFAKSKGIAVTAYSPLGSPDRPWAKPGDPQLMDDPKLKDLAKKYKKTPAQILLRYQIDRGVITIPKSVTKSRIQQNIEIFDFSLSPEDIAYLNTFDCNGRLCPLAPGYGHKYHPFENDEV